MVKEAPGTPEHPGNLAAQALCIDMIRLATCTRNIMSTQAVGTPEKKKHVLQAIITINKAFKKEGSAEKSIMKRVEERMLVDKGLNGSHMKQHLEFYANKIGYKETFDKAIEIFMDTLQKLKQDPSPQAKWILRQYRKPDEKKDSEMETSKLDRILKDVTLQTLVCRAQAEAKKIKLVLVVQRDLPSCLTCGLFGHQEEECTLFGDIKARIFMKQGRCFKCASKEHLSNKCNKEIKCSECSGPHDWTLCSSQNPSATAIGYIKPNARRPCGYCDENHTALECPLSPQNKYIVLDIRQACQRCLSRTHLIEECSKQYQCRYCPESHYYLHCLHQPDYGYVKLSELRQQFNDDDVKIGAEITRREIRHNRSMQHLGKVLERIQKEVNKEDTKANGEQSTTQVEEKRETKEEIPTREDLLSSSTQATPAFYNVLGVQSEAGSWQNYPEAFSEHPSEEEEATSSLQGEYYPEEEPSPQHPSQDETVGEEEEQTWSLRSRNSSHSIHESDNQLSEVVLPQPDRTNLPRDCHVITFYVVEGHLIRTQAYERFYENSESRIFKIGSTEQFYEKSDEWTETKQAMKQATDIVTTFMDQSAKIFTMKVVTFFHSDINITKKFDDGSTDLFKEICEIFKGKGIWIELQHTTRAQASDEEVQDFVKYLHGKTSSYSSSRRVINAHPELNSSSEEVDTTTFGRNRVFIVICSNSVGTSTANILLKANNSEEKVRLRSLRSDYTPEDAESKELSIRTIITQACHTIKAYVRRTGNSQKVQDILFVHGSEKIQEDICQNPQASVFKQTHDITKELSPEAKTWFYKTMEIQHQSVEDFNTLANIFNDWFLNGDSQAVRNPSEDQGSRATGNRSSIESSTGCHLSTFLRDTPQSGSPCPPSVAAPYPMEPRLSYA